jgi:phosphoribosylamine--glycine ligase
MRYLVLGTGGREHAITWRLLNDGSASEVYVLPGNGGIDDAYRVNINPSDHAAIAAFCVGKKIDMVVVGPEAYLVEGIVDYLEAKKIPVFGPSRKAAQLEGSKIFAKMIMEKYKVPTAGHYDFIGPEKLLAYVENVKEYPIVIKLDGLAAGKGVCLPMSREEAVEFIKENVKDGTPVLVEDFLEGEEASVLGLSDGERVYPFIAAQDHKRVFDGDKGPNTGGMGAYAPAPVADAALLEEVRVKVLQPVVDGMKKEGTPFKGILYAGLMVKGREIKVVEFNVRFGDPETQVLLPLIDGKLGDLFKASIEGTLTPETMKFKNKHAITVVVASGGYPGSYEKGKEIHGLDKVPSDIIVFHAGTEKKDGKIVTSGGRVLTVTAVADTLSAARDSVYKGLEAVSFEKGFYRKDIAHRALK